MTMNARPPVLIALTSVLPVLLLTFSGSFAAEKERPKGWAVPVQAEGVPNLFQITPTLYRSAQPTRQGFQTLARMGIRTVINLRGGSDDDRAAREAGIGLESVPLSAAHVRHESNVRILRLLGRPELGPILLHCQHGSDRTGMIAALYRMVYQGWSREKAIEEMRKGGYGFHAIWGGLVDYLETVDVAALRKELTVPPDAAPMPPSDLLGGRLNITKLGASDRAATTSGQASPSRSPAAIP
jgi:protein tyrosine phosphatase (PTP) superfamily phosphohydrolase (DUF442 family)